MSGSASSAGAAAPAGVAPGGARGNQTPNWLAPSTPNQIKAQATATVKAAYAPEYQSLNQQAKQAQGIADKRAADNRFYQTWLGSQMDTLQAHSDAARAHIEGLITNLNQAQSGLYATQGQDLIGAADQRAGNVSNNADSRPLTQGLQQNQQYNQGLLLDTSQFASSRLLSGIDQTDAARMNDSATISDIRIKQQADLSNALTKIANERALLNTKEGGDIVKEIGRLQGVEMQKEEANRNYAAAAEKLGLNAANIQNEILTRTQNANTSAQNAKTRQSQLQLDWTKAMNAQANSDRNYQLNQAKFGLTAARDMYEREHGLGPYKPAKSGQKPALSLTSQNAVYSKIDEIRGHLQQLVSAGVGAQQAWHILHAGGTVAVPFKDATGKAKSRNMYFGPVGDDGLLNAAYNTLDGAAGLTKGDVAYLESLGVSNPGARLHVAQVAKPAPSNPINDAVNGALRKLGL